MNKVISQKGEVFKSAAMQFMVDHVEIMNADYYIRNIKGKKEKREK